MERPLRIVIAGGGTGGHLFPGIAVAEEIKRRDMLSEVIFVGTEHGIEASVIPREGYPLKFLRAEGVVGKSVTRKTKGAAKMVFSLLDSYRLLRGLRPDVVIGTGGYASFSPVLAGRMMSLPTVVMEQNAVPGLANTLLGKIVDAVCVTYHESISYFPADRTFITGNPVRDGLMSGTKEKAYELFGLGKDKFTILVLGGSSGARKINNAVCEGFSHLTMVKEKIQFLHQTGKTDYESIRETYRKWGFSGTVTAFIHRMPEAYAAADLVISRAGASTLAELTAIGKASILIPYPYAANNHQEFNARKLSGMNAARIILDRDVNGEGLAKNIMELYSDDNVRLELQKACSALGEPDAAQKVVDIVMSLVRANKARRNGRKAAGNRTGKEK